MLTSNRSVLVRAIRQLCFRKRLGPSASFLKQYSVNSSEISTHSGVVTVWWDATCPLCTKEINFLKKLDVNKKIQFNALGQDTPDTLSVNGCPITKKDLLARFHAREGSQGELLSGAAAFAAMWRVVPHKGFKCLGEIARRPYILWTLERMYRGFLVIRPGVQRLARVTSKE